MEIIKLKNFDFTQFISFNATVPYYEIKNILIELFKEIDFVFIDFEDMNTVKKDYYSNYWKEYSFELQKDDFLSDIVDWENLNDIPEFVEKFVNIMYKLLSLNVISDLVFIICSFADPIVGTNNEVIYINKYNLYEGLFKMSQYCEIEKPYPYNLIINIIN